MQKKIIGITGSTGFIGTHLVESLVDEGYTLRCFLRAGSLLPSNWAKKVEVQRGSYDRVEDLVSFADGCHEILHLAGITIADSREEFMKVNLRYTEALLSAIVQTKNQPTRFVYFSSQEAVHPSKNSQPINEETKNLPFTDYGVSKLMAENLVREKCAQGGIDLTILRPGPVYGPRDKDFLVFFRAMAKGFSPIFLYPSLISPIFVKNLTYYVTKVLENPDILGTYFMADSTDLSANDFAGLIRKSYGSWSIPVPISRFPLYILAKIGDLVASTGKKRPLVTSQKYKMLTWPNLTIDRARLNKTFGPPPYTTAEGVEQTWQWFISFPI